MPNKTNYTRTVSENDPNITLLDKHDLTCKTGNGSENASNKTLLDIMDNQESTDNNNPNKARQVTPYNLKCLSDKASIKTTLDNQDSQGNTTSGAGKPEPKILTHNNSLIIDNTSYASGKVPNNTSSDTQASDASQNSMPVHSVASSKGSTLNENNPSDA